MNLLKSTIDNIKPLNKKSMLEKEEYLKRLLKTPNGLGKLEDIAIQLSGISSSYKVANKAVIVMAADNGVEKENVSASKREITQHVVDAMLEGEASVSSLCKTMQSDLFVVDLGIDTKKVFEKAITKKIMPKGTNNIRYEPAMSNSEAVKAVETGIEMVEQVVSKGYNLLAVGEMGIGNTTTSSACLKVLTNLPLLKIVGYGSGIDQDTLLLKIKVIEDAININNPNPNDPLDIIQKVGGLDIAAMTGVYLGAAMYKVPVVLDGLISGVSALLAYKLNPLCKEYMIPSHISEEPGAKYIMDQLDFEPMLNMHMKLGEGSGAVLVFPFIEAACNFIDEVRLYPEI